MRFRLLGPVEVSTDGHPIDIGGPRQRAVLATLLVNAATVVPVDVLVDRVWGTDPPRSARDTLRSYTTRIRRALERAAAGDHPPARVLCQAGGYRIDLDPDRVDLHRFRRLIVDARRPDSPDGQRAQLLRQAVDLWGGEPLTGVPGEWAARMRAAWRREWLDATVAWAEAELRLGRTDEVLGPLTELAGQHLEVEPLTATLMRALVAAGRPTDALVVGATHRRQLADAYGTEQCHDLRALYASILRGEQPPGGATGPTGGTAGPTGGTAGPAGGTAGAAGGAAGTVGAAGDAAGAAGGATAVGSGIRHDMPVPAQLPADVPAFAGRGSYLYELDALLTAGARTTSKAVVISAVSGTAGVGKSALAVHWAHRVAGRFTDGQLYVNLRGFDASNQVMSAAEAVRGLLYALGVPADRVPSTLDAQLGLYRSLLAGKRVLIVLDNARDAEQVRPLLPATDTALVVITSRNQLTSLVATDGAHPLPLDLLTPQESRDLLVQRLGGDRVGAEPDAVDTIVTACARLPLALAIVAARARQTGFPLAALAAELTDSRHRLDALDAGDATAEVRAVFSWSYTALGAAAARLFRLLGLHPGPDVSAAAAASLSGQPRAQARRQLTELVRANLLTEPVPGRYTFHDLLRAYAADLAAAVDPDHDRQAALRRVLDHYLHSARTVDTLLPPITNPIALPEPLAGVTPERLTDYQHALAWLAAEQPAILAAIDLAPDHGWDAHVWHLAWVMRGYLTRVGHMRAWSAVGQAALSAAQRLGDPLAQAVGHDTLALRAIMRGRFDDADAHLRRADELCRDADATSMLGYVYLHRGMLLHRSGRAAEGVAQVLEALDRFQSVGHRRGQANALNDLAWYHTEIGEHQQALSYGQRAVGLNQQVGNTGGEATAWDTVGYAHHGLGQHEAAVGCYRLARELAHTDGNRYLEAGILLHLGETRLATDDRVAARAAWSKALHILDGLGYAEAERVRAKLDALDRSADTAADAPSVVSR